MCCTRLLQVSFHNKDKMLIHYLQLIVSSLNYRCKNKPNSDEPGYAGSACQQILCEPQCRNGECIEYVLRKQRASISLISIPALSPPLSLYSSSLSSPLPLPPSPPLLTSPGLMYASVSPSGLDLIVQYHCVQCEYI